MEGYIWKKLRRIESEPNVTAFHGKKKKKKEKKQKKKKKLILFKIGSKLNHIHNATFNNFELSGSIKHCRCFL